MPRIIAETRAGEEEVLLLWEISNGNRVRSGGVLGFHRNGEIAIELRKHRLPGAFDRALQVDGLNAKEGQRAAAREQACGARAAGAIKMFLQNLPKPGVFGG